MMTGLELPIPATDTTTEDAAATTMRRTGKRLQAPPRDVNLVLAALFGEVQS